MPLIPIDRSSFSTRQDLFLADPNFLLWDPSIAALLHSREEEVCKKIM